MKKYCPITLVILSVTFHLSFGQSGALDTSFGNFGIIQTDVTANKLDLVSTILVLDDQKILAAGGTQSTKTSLDFALVRYWPDGRIDSSFGENGIVILNFNGGYDRAWDMAIQPDGRIILAGQADAKEGNDFALARFHADGTIDTSFSHDGMLTTNLGADYELAGTVALQADGKIIAAGRTADGFSSNFAIVRYHANGEIDASFGEEGVVNTNVREEDEIKSVIVQPDRKILVSGFAAISAKGDFALARYLEDGTLDKQFGLGGIAVTDLEGLGLSDWSTSMILEEDGKIVVAGNANYNNLFLGTDIGVVRYHSDGSQDETFANNGIYILHLGEGTQAYSIARQLDGKYIVSGQTDLVFGQNMWLLTRLLNSGELDTTFSDGGIVLTDHLGENELITSTVIQRDSRILVGGYNGNQNNYNFTLARYIADFTMSVLEIETIECNGDSTASFGIYVDGGVPPYQYSLDGVNFSPMSLFFNQPAGEYFITVMDQNGTSAIYGPLNISQPPPPPGISVTIIENTIDISADGPGEFLYSIDGGISFSQDSIFTDLVDGVYEVIVEDQSGCNLYHDHLTITFTGITPAETLVFELTPNPCSEKLFIQHHGTLTNTYITITEVSGRIVKTEIYPDFVSNLQVDVSGLTNGLYYLKLNDGLKTEMLPFVVSR